LEFVGLEEEQGESVLENVKERFDRPPSIREIRRVVFTIKNRRAGFGPDELGYRSQSPPPGPRPTFADWAKENPEQAKKLLKVINPTGFTAKRMIEAMAEDAT
jgi:hypothetical protein